VRVVVLACFVFRDGNAPEHLGLLHALRDDGSLQILAEIRHRHVFLLERGDQLFVVFDLVLRLQVVEDLLELLFADAITQFLAALNDEHLVDNADEQHRRHVGNRFSQLFVALWRREVDLLATRADLGDLPCFEIGLGEDLAVDLHEHLLEDFRVSDGRDDHRHEGGQSGRPA